MKTFLSITFVVILSAAAAFLMTPAADVNAGPQFFCDDMPRQFVDPGDTLYPFACTWRGTFKTCPIYVDANTGGRFVDGGPTGCDIP